MLASEIIYQVLGPHFNDRVAPHPIPEKFDLQGGVYITFQKISSSSFSDDGGWTGHDYVRVQVNVHHTDMIECEKNAIQVKNLMNDQEYCSCEIAGGSGIEFDPETQLYYEQIDFYVWQSSC
ncbi:MAG: hypothetical protein LWW88_12985 [Acinetobacter sp.]|uniref:hypothetical protein n=1 Tax=Acinetobacter sp. TaxID=472 RepID=UPI00258ADC47|nr:hypothetical protein [Acinetobacter sp.]MCE1272442.1 hypothetical protein [Acinetobacter sp.]